MILINIGAMRHSAKKVTLPHKNLSTVYSLKQTHTRKTLAEIAYFPSGSIRASLHRVIAAGPNDPNTCIPQIEKSIEV